jgi:hypothetical protein
MNSDDHSAKRRFTWIGFSLGFIGGVIAGIYICPDSFAGHSARIVFIMVIAFIVAYCGGRCGYSLWDLLWDWLILR